jgi:hypothetical protein
MRDHDTNTGWWTERPDKVDRPSSYASLQRDGASSGRSENVWVRAALVVALMVALGCAVVRLASL